VSEGGAGSLAYASGFQVRGAFYVGYRWPTSAWKCCAAPPRLQQLHVLRAAEHGLPASRGEHPIAPRVAIRVGRSTTGKSSRSPGPGGAGPPAAAVSFGAAPLAEDAIVAAPGGPLAPPLAWLFRCSNIFRIACMRSNVLVDRGHLFGRRHRQPRPLICW